MECALTDDVSRRYADAARDYSPYTMLPESGARHGLSCPDPTRHVHTRLCQPGRGGPGCGGDSRRLKRWGGRFTHPVFVVPGQRLTTALYEIGAGAGGRKSLRFDTIDRDGHTVISNGLRRLRHERACSPQVDSADWSAVPDPHVIELMRRGCADDPERPAIILEDGLTVTRRELLDRSQRFAGYLRGRLKTGDRVVVMLDNRVEFMIALFAIMANRAILVSIAPTVSSTTPATSWPIPAGAGDLRSRPRNRYWSSFGRAARLCASSWWSRARSPRALRTSKGGRAVRLRHGRVPARGRHHRLLHFGYHRRAEGMHAPSRLVAARGRSGPGCSAAAGRPPALLPPVLLRRSGDPAHHLARLARHHGGDAALQRLAVLGRGDAA